jgi:opacity protein-like surface antigen
MKKIIASSGFLLIFFFFINGTYAQQRLQLRIGYNANMPVGTFKDFMGKTSFRGFDAELSYPVNTSLRLGLGVMYNDYYEKFPRQLYETKDGTISAVVTNSIQTNPILVTANYEFLKDAAVRPYIGAGAGFNLITFGQYFGEFGDGKTSFKPAFMGDAGVNIPMNRVVRLSGINIGVNFNYMPFKHDVLKNLNNVGVHAGIYFPLK